MASSSSTMPNPVLCQVTDASPVSYAYPIALAEYKEVVADTKLFMNTLETLHSTLGTKFMIPVIGGKELDLHRLFVEVTSRGGIEKIVREKKWKEVTAIFNFPSSATNASFILRKYYVSLLHNYEQIYYFKAKNWVPSSDLVHTPHRTPMSARGGYAVSALPTATSSEVPQQNINIGNMLGSQANHTAPLDGTSVTGIIDGKFDSGYLVTITIGSQKLKGVLYHAAESIAPPAPLFQPVILPYQADVSVGALTASGTQRRRRRKKSEIKRRDPAHPKPNRSGYNFFFQEQHARLKTLHPGKDKEISKMIGELWNNLNEADKSVYQEKAMRDKERYKSEMEGYREKIRTGEIIPHATTPSVQQRVVGPDITMVDINVGELVGEFSARGKENTSSDKSVSLEEDMLMENESDVDASQGGAVAEGCNANVAAVETARVDTVEKGVEEQ